MSNSAVIRSCATLNEAYIVCELLNSRGIRASIDNANHAAVNWFIVAALGGVHVRVPASQFQEAKLVIISQVEEADELLFQGRDRYDAPTKHHRWKAISMLIIWFELLSLPFMTFLVWLEGIIPAHWVSQHDTDPYAITYAYGAGLPPDFNGESGLLLLLLIVALVGWDLASTRLPRSTKETTE